MNKFVLRQSLLLLLTAAIWGVAFVAQSVGMDFVGPYTFNGVRCLIGGLVLLPFIAVNNHMEKKTEEKKSKKLIVGGLLCGIILFVASSLQQIGLQYTTVGKAGFITAMYIVIVPIIGIFFKKKAGLRIWIGVAIAVTGLYLLCMTSGGFHLQFGDLLVLFCAIVFSFHIIVVDHFAPLVNGVKMSCIQFFTCGIISCICMFLFETPKMDQIFAAWQPILYAGALSCGVGYTLQIVGQKGMNPTVASLIMSLESVISVLAGWIILGQKLSAREVLGCLFMFAAIILVQLPNKKKEME
ncbi:MAG: DMT family transporter [Clostridiales bacterium]|nr:DMT family transporter [Clostridiales bacterium]